MKTYSFSCFILVFLASCSDANFEVAQSLEESQESSIGEDTGEKEDSHDSQDSDSGIVDSGRIDAIGNDSGVVQDSKPEIIFDTQKNETSAVDSMVDSVSSMDTGTGEKYYSCGKQNCGLKVYGGAPCCEGGPSDGVCTASCNWGRMVFCKKDSDCVDNYLYPVGYHCCTYSGADSCVAPGTSC